MVQKQLEIWAVPIDEEQTLQYQMFELKKKQDSLRKGLYKRLEDIESEIAELRNELELIKGKEAKKTLILGI